jgi:RNA exonuclease 1
LDFFCSAFFHAGFVQTQPSTGIPIQTYALDCEMVRTAFGLELARISVINEQMAVVYERFVVPDNEILDYCTQWSGITADTYVCLFVSSLHFMCV